MDVRTNTHEHSGSFSNLPLSAIMVVEVVIDDLEPCAEVLPELLNRLLVHFR